MNLAKLDRLEQKAKRKAGHRYPGAPLLVCFESDQWYIWDNGHNVSGPFETEAEATDAASEMAADWPGTTPIFIDDMDQ